MPTERLILFPEKALRSRQMMAVEVGFGWGFTIRRDCLEEVGKFDENLRAAEDIEFFLRLVQGPWTWSGIPSVLVRVNRQAQRVTLVTPLRGQCLLYILDKHKNFLGEQTGLRTEIYWMLVVVLVEAGQRKLGRRFLLKMVRAEPFNIRIWVLMISNELRHSSWGRRLLGLYRIGRSRLLAGR